MKRYWDVAINGNLVCGQQVQHPRLSDKKGQVEKAKPRIPSGNITAFQDYIPAMMSTLDNPWKPLNKGTTTPSWTTVPPLVFLSMPGTPISRPPTGEELEEEQIRMNFSVVDKTVLIPEGREGAESATSPINFTRELQNRAALKVKPQGQSLLQTLGFEVQDKGHLTQIFTCQTDKAKD